MKRIVTIATLALLMGILPMTAQAQTWGAPDYMKGKLVTGGQIGAGFSGNTLHLGIAPQLGFRPIRSLEVGIRLGYDLDYHFRSYYNPYSVCYHYFSGAIYANYEIFRGIYVHAEDEELCCLVRGHADWFNTVFAGVGYRHYYNTSYVYYAFLLNLSWIFDDYGYATSPYASPYVVRMGYCWTL